MENTQTYRIYTYWGCWYRGAADGGSQLFRTKLAVGTHGDTKKLTLTCKHTRTHLGPLLTRLPAGSSWGHSFTFPKDTKLHPFTVRPPQPSWHFSMSHTPASQSKVPTMADLPAPAAGNRCLALKHSSLPLTHTHHSAELNGPTKWLKHKSYMLPWIRAPC